MAGPLEGLLVVDLSWGAPGSIIGMLLADYGARVVKVERPAGGPDSRSVTRQAWDRSKWSIELDPAVPHDAATIRALIDRADIFVESLGPRRAAALGFGHDTVRASNPALIVCSLTGYGHDGPWRDRPGYDALVASRLGQVAEQPGPREGPKFLGHPSIAYGTAFIATMGVLAALHARHDTGAGQVIDASMLDGALAQSAMNWWWNEGGLSYLARSGTEQGFGRGRLMTDLFLCADGQYVMVHTGGTGGFKRAMDLLGLGDGIRTIEGALEMSVPLDDDEYHIARNLAPEAMRTRPRQEWVDLFHAADLAALPVNKPAEVLLDEQVQFADVVVELHDPDRGPLRMAGPVIRFADSPADPPVGAPLVGRDNIRIAELLARPVRSGSAPSATPGMVAPRQALTGLRVLDFSSFFATAYGAKFLSDLGADVIKIEPLEGDQMRPLPDPFEACQRGKRNIALDLKAPDGRAIVRDLVATADVVLHNLRPGKAEKIGIGYDDLRAIKPDLVYCYLPGFGSKGPKSHLKSFAPLLSGFTGLLWEGAGVTADRPVRRVMGNEDYNNGFVGAIAALMGIAHRDRTGRGQYIEMPQLHSSLLVTTEQCLDADGNLVSGLAVDAEQMGWNPLYRMYRTADGWICLAVVGDRMLKRLIDVLALQLPAGLTYSDAVDPRGSAELVIKTLGIRLAEATSERVFALLDGAGVPCEIPLDYPIMPELLWDDWALDSGRVLEHEHPTHGLIREVGFTCRLSDTPCVSKGPGALLGQHTTEVLTELGYGTTAIAGLLDRGVCIQSPGTASGEGVTL